MFHGVTDVTVSPIFCDRLKVQAYLTIQAYLCKKCCKQQYSREALFWCNLNPKGIIILPYDEKQFILLTSMGNT